MEQHLTWPDAFAVVAIVAGFVAFIFVFARASSRGAFDMGAALHRERLAETRTNSKRDASWASSKREASWTATTEASLSPSEMVAVLVAAGMLVQNEDGTYSPAKTAEPTPLVTPPPAAKSAP